jgi:nitrate/TMAO reductase-like tetraheme cytochrome c subunit
VTTALQQRVPIARRSKRGWPKINLDLNRPAHRRTAILAALGLLFVLLVIGAAGIQGYDYMESTDFCGTLCHSMGPQYTQHNVSAHVNVACVSCHIGPGVEHFVRSKIDGMRQLFLTLNNSVVLPIKGPVQNLRPARETCETCHNPQSFKDNIIKSITHYDNDQANTKLQTTLVLRMGGTQADTGFSQGIHWHISGKVYYIATDAQRQIIPWIGVEQKDGSLKEYFSTDLLNKDRKAFVAQARANNQVRLMDCIDCHNRTAHYIPTPEEAVDQALSLNILSTAIPFIRAKTVDLLKQN